MTDYLELLLARRQKEEEEERIVLTLGAEETAFLRREKQRGAEEAPEAPHEIGADTAGLAARVWRQTEGLMDAPRRKFAGEDLEQALSRAVDALPERTEDRTRVHGEAELSALPAQDAAFPLSAGAAGLEQRLSQAALAAAAPARAVFREEAEGTPPPADWEEFDRRLERDARRYDGGLGMY